MVARAVLFDLDGTLADTAADLATALNRLRREQGLEPVPPELTRPHTSSGARGLLKIGFDLTPEHTGYAGLRDRFLDFYGEGLCLETRLYEGVSELLAALDRRQIPWGVVTNKTARFTEPLLELLALRGRAACVVSGDTTARAKPAPDPLLRAASDMHLSPVECLYVGDDLRDVQAARAAGMGAIAAGWGYLGIEGDPDSWGADAVLGHPQDVLALLS